MTANAACAARGAGGESPDRYLPVPGGRVRFRDEGGGPPVLLVHGWTLDLDMWGPQVAALANRYRLIRFDRRGFGLSSGDPSLENDVADLDALCRHLQLRRVSAVGMSQGARAVLEWAAGATERVACIVLDGAPNVDGDVADESDVPLAHYRTLLETQGVGAVRREWAAHPLAQLTTPDPGARRLLAAMLERYPGNDLHARPSRPARAVDRARLESLTTPALVISGARDLESRLNAAAVLAGRLPRAERAVIPGAGHLPNLDAPDAYNRAVAAFLERHTTAAT